MLESLFLALFGFSALLCVLTAWYKEEITYFGYIVWPALSVPCWIILAVIVTSIERTSTFIVENATAPENSTIIEHITTYTGGTFMTYLFIGLAIIFAIITINRVLEMFAHPEEVS